MVGSGHSGAGVCMMIIVQWLLSVLWNDGNALDISMYFSADSIAYLAR